MSEEQLSPEQIEAMKSAFGVAILKPVISDLPSMNANQFAVHAWDILKKLESEEFGEDDQVLEAVSKLMNLSDKQSQLILLRKFVPTLVRAKGRRFQVDVAKRLTVLTNTPDIPSMRRIMGGK